MSWQVGPPILRARLKASLFFTVSYTPAKVCRGECLPVVGRWGWCRGARRKEGRTVEGLVRRRCWDPENRPGPQVRGSWHLWAATMSRWGGLRPGTCDLVLRWATCPMRYQEKKEATGAGSRQCCVSSPGWQAVGRLQTWGYTTGPPGLLPRTLVTMASSILQCEQL